MVHIFRNLAYVPGPIVGGYLAGINPGMTFPIAAVIAKSLTVQGRYIEIN
jgi:hypothetical protein